jgi:hypothetical protein
MWYACVAFTDPSSPIRIGREQPFTLAMNRRQFAFWISAGIFSLGERLGAESLDTLAAVVMQCTEKCVNGKTCVELERWTYHQDSTWRWFDRETLVDDTWKLTGRTTPIHRQTGEHYTAQTGYLEETLVPDEVRFGTYEAKPHDLPDYDDDDYGEVSDKRRARDGRPPSKWLRSLYAEELRLWLPDIDVPDVGVSGMTVWTHLTRDHRFDADRIEGLNDQELARLHSAAHYGY